MKRAHHPDQREQRRQAIMTTVGRIFAEKPFSAIRMSDLAQELGLAKGTLYLYYPTKESLFLALLQEHLELWFDRVESILDTLARPANPEAISEALMEGLRRDPQLPRLLALLHGVLEQNVTRDEAVAFKRFLRARTAQAAARMEHHLPGQAPGTGRLVFFRLHALVIGVQSMAAPPPIIQEALQDSDLADLAVDFEAFLAPCLRDLLRGMTTTP
jgi:AcrR family transcriptional regulator